MIVNNEEEKLDTSLDFIKQYMYYFIIGILSVAVLVFVPMIGSETGLAFNVPDSAAGWIVYIVTKVLVLIINMMIFHSFVCQGKLNAKCHPNYIKAVTLLASNKVKKYKPRTESEFRKGTYGYKMMWLSLGTLAGMFGIASAVMQFDVISFISYFMVIGMAIITGVFTKMNTQEYYESEFLHSIEFQIKEEETRKENENE